MEELVVVSDTWFYSMKDRMDQYQSGFTSRFECIEDRIDHYQAVFTSQFEHL